MNIELATAIEAILFASGDSVSIERLSRVLDISKNEIEACAKLLADSLETEGRGIRLLRLNESLQLCSAPQYAGYITRILEQRKPPMLSQSAVEVLAVVAYFQPVTRSYIEQIRGVDSSYTVSSLIERGLIEERGKLNAPGRPALLCTTDAFLKTMNITKLDELPALPNMKSSDAMESIQQSIDKLQVSSDVQLSMDMPDK